MLKVVATEIWGMFVTCCYCSRHRWVEEHTHPSLQPHLNTNNTGLLVVVQFPELFWMHFSFNLHTQPMWDMLLLPVL